MYPSQTNTQAGSRSFLSAADLTGLEGRLLTLGNASGIPKLAASTAITDHVPYLLVDGRTAGNPNIVEPFTGEANRRVRFKSTCVSGDRLVLADPATAADAGKLRKLPAAAGTYIVIAIAEESAADTQMALVRPYGPFTVIVP